MKPYTFSNGITITPRNQPCGAFCAMGETRIEEEKVFDVHQDGKLLATAETWDQAKAMVFDLLSNVPDHLSLERSGRENAMLREKTDSWKPIETAPKNTKIIIYWAKSNHCEDATLHVGDDGVLTHCLFDGERLNDEPTHWMPFHSVPNVSDHRCSTEASDNNTER